MKTHEVPSVWQKQSDAAKPDAIAGLEEAGHAR